MPAQSIPLLWRGVRRSLTGWSRRGAVEMAQVPNMGWWRGAVGILQIRHFRAIYKSASTVHGILFQHPIFAQPQSPRAARYAIMDNYSWQPYTDIG